MSASFADSAMRCGSLAAQVLGWRPSEFWIATPAELAMALAPLDGLSAVTPPSRDMIADMMERDTHD